jgi:hypothetical protein
MTTRTQKTEAKKKHVTKTAPVDPKKALALHRKYERQLRRAPGFKSIVDNLAIVVGTHGLLLSDEKHAVDDGLAAHARAAAARLALVGIHRCSEQRGDCVRAGGRRARLEGHCRRRIARSCCPGA